MPRMYSKEMCVLSYLWDYQLGVFEWTSKVGFVLQDMENTVRTGTYDGTNRFGSGKMDIPRSLLRA